MISDLALGLGLVAILEGLVLALAPSRLRNVLEFLDRAGPEATRLIGLIALVIGVGLVWLARG